MNLRNAIGFCVLGLLPVLTVRGQGASDLAVLKVVPAEAWVVMTVRSLTEVDQKIGTLAQQLALPIPPSPLAMAKGYFGLLGGLDDAREIAMAIMPAENVDSPGDSMVLFFPIKDYKQLLTFLEPVEVAPGISKIKLGTDEAFMSEKDGFAIAAPTQILLERATRSTRSISEQLEPDHRKPFSADDITIWANVEAFSSSNAFPRFRKMLEDMQGDPQRMQDLKTVCLSLQMAAEGLHFKLYVDSKPGTEAARMAEAVRATDGSMLTGLPSEGLILAYGTTASAQSSTLISENIKRMLDRIPAERRRAVLSDAKLESIRQFVDSTLTQLRGMSLAMNSTSSPDNGRLTVTSIFKTDGQAGKVREQFAEFVKRMKTEDAPSAESASSTATATPAATMQYLEYVSAAETVAGAPVDQLRWNPPASDEDRPLVEWLQAFFGKDGFVARIAAVGNSDLVITLGGTASDLESTLSALKAGQNPVGTQDFITQAASHLPPNKSTEGYVKVDELLRTVAAASKAMDEPWLMDDIPEVNAAVSFSTTNYGNAGSRTDLFVPTEVMVTIKDMAMQRRAARTAPSN